jgi:micrococcal nuclease
LRLDIVGMIEGMDFILAVLFAILSWFGYGAETPASSAPQEASTATAEVLRVVDGDTIVVDLSGAEETVRYIGIDTPEPYRDGEPACFSLEASLRNEELVSGKRVELVADREDRDRFDRLLRYVYAEGVFVNEVLIEEGYATPLRIEPNTTYANEFSQLAAVAKQEGEGMWSRCKVN